MPDLDSRLLAHVRETGLFPRPGLALLAVSGGEDSVALLDLFSALDADLGLGLALAHVDHGITPGSEDVAEQVLALAVRYEVRGHLVSLALGPDASETGARRERYRALREIQQRLVADYLVTAHHADDQMETVLYRLLRGSAPAGLAGIPARGPQGLVRPLLPFRRTELHEWLLTRHPDLRQEHAPFSKGMLAFNVLTSVGYGIVAFAKAGPSERDTRGMAASIGIDERVVGALIITPAVLDAYRYFNPGSRWAAWTSRGAKIGSVLLVLR